MTQETVRALLQSLLDLKNYKDKNGKTDMYLQEKQKLWRKVEEFLAEDIQSEQVRSRNAPVTITD